MICSWLTSLVICNTTNSTMGRLKLVSKAHRRQALQPLLHRLLLARLLHRRPLAVQHPRHPLRLQAHLPHLPTAL